jgi:hypothetical protein
VFALAVETGDSSGERRVERERVESSGGSRCPAREVPERVTHRLTADTPSDVPVGVELRPRTRRTIPSVTGTTRRSPVSVSYASRRPVSPSSSSSSWNSSWTEASEK